MAKTIFPALVFSILALCALQYASFTLVASFNGTGEGDYTGQFLLSQPTGVLAVGDRLYVSDAGKAILYAYNATTYKRIGGAMGARGGSDSVFYNPLRMAFDNGTLYIADGGSGAIKLYSGIGSQISDWNTGSNLNKPTGLAIVGDRVYIADAGKKQVFAYSKSSKSYVSVVIDSGGSDGKLSSPQDIEFYKGRYYVSDSDKGLVFVYDSNFTYLATIGRGLGGVTLHSPRGIALYNDHLFVADTTSNSIVEFALDGYPVEVLDASVQGANLSYPEDMAVADGRLFVADTFNKLVKVFAINETRGNNTVQQLLASANSSIKSLSQVKSAAQKVNITPGDDTFDSDLAQAQSDYSHFVYSSASSISQRIIDSAPKAQANLSQRVEVAVKQVVKQATDRVAPYRAQAKGNAATLVGEFDNKVSDINSKLSGKFYLQAVDVSLTLGNLSDAIADATVGNAAKEEQAKKDKLASQVGLQLDLASTKLKSLQEKLAAYRQPLNTSSYGAVLENARKALSQEDYASANKTAASLISDLDAQDRYLSQLAQGIDGAKANLSLLELEFNSSAAKPMLLSADISAERAQFESAKQTVYQNPALAVAMAQQASQVASVKIKDAQSLSIAVAAILVMSGLILLLGLVFFLHIRGRKKRGLGDADALPHGKREGSR